VAGAAIAAAPFEVAALIAEVVSETALTPIVEAVIGKVLPDALKSILPQDVLDKLVADAEATFKEQARKAIDEIRRASRFQEITKQFARAGVVPPLAQFARAGADVNFEVMLSLSDNFVRQSERKSFLSRQESRRTNTGLARIGIASAADALERLNKARGE